MLHWCVITLEISMISLCVDSIAFVGAYNMSTMMYFVLCCLFLLTDCWNISSVLFCSIM